LSRLWKYFIDAKKPHVLAADAQHFILGHRDGQQVLGLGGDAGGLQLLVEGHVGAADHVGEDHVRLLQLDLVDQRAELRVAQRVVFLAHHRALEHVLDVLAGDLVGGTRPDVVRADQEEGLGLLFLGHPVQARQHLLRRLLAGIEHVLGLLQAFVEGRVVQQAVILLEHRQHRLARGRGPAAEDGRHAVVFQQLLGLFGEGRPVAGTVFLMILILRPRMPPMALIWSMARRSAWIEPVSLMAMVPVAECSWPTVTSVSVMASLVVLTLAVGYCWAEAMPGRAAAAAPAARPIRILRRGSEGGLEDEECDMRYSFRALLLDSVWAIVASCKHETKTGQRTAPAAAQLGTLASHGSGASF
jgi:hypothetical protein